MFLPLHFLRGWGPEGRPQGGREKQPLAHPREPPARPHERPDCLSQATPSSVRKPSKLDALSAQCGNPASQRNRQGRPGVPGPCLSGGESAWVLLFPELCVCEETWPAGLADGRSRHSSPSTPGRVGGNWCACVWLCGLLGPASSSGKGQG